MLYRKAPPQPPQFLLRAVVAGTAAFLGMRVMACGGAVEPTGPEGNGTSGASGSGTSGASGVTGSGSTGYYGGYDGATLTSGAAGYSGSGFASGYSGMGTGSSGFTGSGSGSAGYTGSGFASGYTGSGSGTAGYTGGPPGLVISGAYGGDTGTAGTSSAPVDASAPAPIPDASVRDAAPGGGYVDDGVADVARIDFDACTCQVPDAGDGGPVVTICVLVCDPPLEREIAPIEFDKVVGEP